MKNLCLALAAFMLCGSAAASATAPKKKPANARPALVAPVEPIVPTDAARRIIIWVGSSGDNHGLPYVVIDKPAARAFLFNARGKAIADAPVLIGIQLGDDATPGVGKKALSELGPAEKTTPAGRFLAKFGRAAGNQKILWVDYATSVALHTIPPGHPEERRRQRMLSPAIDDNRITFGCINVPTAFYNGVSSFFARRGGYVYILPDAKSLEEVFPPMRVQPFLNAGA